MIFAHITHENSKFWFKAAKLLSSKFKVEVIFCSLNRIDSALILIDSALVWIDSALVWIDSALVWIARVAIPPPFFQKRCTTCNAFGIFNFLKYTRF